MSGSKKLLRMSESKVFVGNIISFYCDITFCWLSVWMFLKHGHSFVRYIKLTYVPYLCYTSDSEQGYYHLIPQSPLSPVTKIIYEH